MITYLDVSLLLAYAGGYKGEKEGHKVPKGTDIFISVSGIFLYSFMILSVEPAFV